MKVLQLFNKQRQPLGQMTWEPPDRLHVEIQDAGITAEISEWLSGGFVSEYARTNQYEDFAESYKAYVRDPELLQFMNPEKYVFMRDEVCVGQEYPPKTLQG